MDKQEKGLLFVEKEELEEKIANLKQRLIGMGTIWKDLSNAITSKPETVKFANAPDEFGSFSINLLKAPSFNWEEIPKIEIIAQLIQELRAAQDRLEAVLRKLRS
ncbi:MAG: hypothetical protein LLG05_14270 [Porphyromonadaceae bacterium]|nr:hypothetical protein [Porphyromonadaceae bacterium]